MSRSKVTRSIAFIAGCAVLAPAACENTRSGPVTSAERVAIVDSLTALATSAYDLSRPNPVQRMMSLYPEQGPVYSTSSGHVSVTRAALEQQIESFWTYVGSNMKNPKWEWTSMHVDVLSPDAAVMTASYRIPHLNPRSMPHVIGGAWTAAFVNRGGRWVVIQEHLSDAPQP